MPVNPLLGSTLLSAALIGSPVAAEEQEPPEAELLEFIGSFMTEDGAWLDPLELDVAERSSEIDDEETQ